MIAEYVIHYNDNQYRKHIPVWFDEENMQAEFLDDGVGEYWEPEEPIGHDWDEDSFEEVVTDEVAYPAVQSWDLEGIEHMDEMYGEDAYVLVNVPE